MKSDKLLWKSDWVYQSSAENQKLSSPVIRTLSKNIVEAIINSPSVSRVFNANEPIVEITQKDLHQMIIDFILEQDAEKEEWDSIWLNEARYHSIEYISKLVMDSVFWSDRFEKIKKNPYVMYWRSQWNLSLAGDAATWQYLLGAWKKTILLSREEFLEIARLCYAQVMKIEGIHKEIGVVIQQVSPLIHTIIVPYSQAKDINYAQRKSQLN